MPLKLQEPATPLHQLSRRFGILDRYTDQAGKIVETGDRTRVALLAALGVDARTPERCVHALLELDGRESTAGIPPVVVVPGGPAVIELPGAPQAWELTITPEEGEPRTVAGRGARVDAGVLPPGYFDLALSVRNEVHRQRRIVTPASCTSVREKTGAARAFGVLLQLYGLRSERNWGVGDLRDLEAFIACAGNHWGAAFLGLNPLHALESNESPYSPTSRLYRNWLYLDVESIPEFEGTPPPRLEELRRLPEVDYESVGLAKRAILEQLFQRFLRRAPGDPRSQAFAAYRAREGDALLAFATYSAMSPADRARMPDAGAAGVPAWQAEHEAAITFHAWLQFELDLQLERVASAAQRAQMRIGLYQDLAVGCDPQSADVWACPALFARGAQIGCPPDPVLPGGQSWGLAPLNPRALQLDGYRHWTKLLRHAMRHSGALRIDHVSGLFRQFWIPDGLPCREGAFVSYPAADLFGILALESARARAVVVGEDLGTVPEEAPETLARWGVLSSKVLYFQVAGGQGGDPKSYPEAALLTVNTHDLPTLAGWWSADDAGRMFQAGLIDEASATGVKAAREKERAALLAALAAEQLIEGASTDCDEATVGAVHGFLARTPAALVGLSLGDVMLQAEPMNLPGTTRDKHPNWRRKYPVPLERLPAEPKTLPGALRTLGRPGGKLQD